MKFFIPHKLSIGDITNLSDKDSLFLMNSTDLKEEDLIEVETLKAVFLARITFIDQASVEVEILKLLGEKFADITDDLIIVQAICSEGKFALIAEKMVELQVSQLTPIETEYSQIDLKEYNRKSQRFEQVIKEAAIQSRNSSPTLLNNAQRLEDFIKEMSSKYSNHKHICLGTENVERLALTEILKQDDKYVFLIGPERGWSDKELDLIRRNGFIFASIGDIIMRTETAPMAVASIVNFVKGKY